MLAGKFMLINDVQPEKLELPIEYMPACKFMLINDVHLTKL